MTAENIYLISGEVFKLVGRDSLEEGGANYHGRLHTGGFLEINPGTDYTFFIHQQRQKDVR
jgi:hypothetical protein